MKRCKLRVGMSDVILTEDAIREIQTAFLNRDPLGPFTRSVIDAILSHFIRNDAEMEEK